MTTMLRKWVTHPWQSRRWFKNPKDMYRIAKKEWEHRGYEEREGHPYYGPIPPDFWPYPVPEGYGVVYRCYGCGELGYHGSHVDGGCQRCGRGGGVVVAHYGKENE
jgi:hypothetical protein